jgi:CheY-like chemotaxis protein
VTVTLPREISAVTDFDSAAISALPGEAARLAAAGRPPIRPRCLSGVTVLVVDDEEHALELFQETLENAGATVRTAKSGADASRACAAARPDLLVTDLGLPQMGGYELSHRIRALAAADGHVTPAVAVTAYARLDDRARSLAAGFQEHLAKPLDPELLVAAVAAATQQKT